MLWWSFLSSVLAVHTMSIALRIRAIKVYGDLLRAQRALFGVGTHREGKRTDC